MFTHKIISKSGLLPSITRSTNLSAFASPPIYSQFTPTSTSPHAFSPLFFTPARYMHAKRRKLKFNKQHGREKRRLKTIARLKVHETWDTDRLMRLYGETFGQRSARRSAKMANRMRFIWNWSANMQPKHRKRHRRFRRPRANLREGQLYDPRFRAKPEDELGPDATYKYKPTPLHIKFKDFAIHPRPIESNLITGNEKVADKILPPDYLDRVFNIPAEYVDFRSRYELTKRLCRYNINDYRKMGIRQRIIARLFLVGMPWMSEEISHLKFLDRRRLVASTEVWMCGAWVGYSELMDFLFMVFFYTIGIPMIILLRGQISAERIQGQHIRDAQLPMPLPLYEKKRVINDSDRTKRPTFEPISPIPRMPLLD